MKTVMVMLMKDALVPLEIKKIVQNKMVFVQAHRKHALLTDNGLDVMMQIMQLIVQIMQLLIQVVII